MNTIVWHILFYINHSFDINYINFLIKFKTKKVYFLVLSTISTIKKNP